MSYHQMYRGTTLGSTLQDALDELLNHNIIQQKIANKFDQCISDALAKKVKNRLNLRGHLKAYRCCDNVWTFIMNTVEIKDSSSIITVDKMKIVACEGKSVRQNVPANANKVSSLVINQASEQSNNPANLTNMDHYEDDIDKESDEDP